MEDKVKDIVLLRRRKIRRRRIMKVTAFLILAGLCFALYQSRNKWLPQLEGIGSKYQSITQNNKDGSNDFSLSISDGTSYQMGSVKDSLVLVSDVYMYIYDVSGTLIDTRQHAYTNPVLNTAGGKALTYESGGNEFRVDSPSKVVYSKVLEDSIIFARISDDGNVAVVTSTDDNACNLTIYSSSGKQIYFRKSQNRIFDVCFSADGESFNTVTCETMNGQVVSYVNSLDINSDKENWTSEAINTLGMKVYPTTSGGVFLVGDTKCAYYDEKGAKTSEYDYENKLKGYSFYDGRAALIFTDEQQRESQLITIKTSTSDPVVTAIDFQVKAVSVDEDCAYILTNKGFYSYDFKGSNTNDKSVSDAYDGFVKIDKYIYIMGYENIARFEFN